MGLETSKRALLTTALAMQTLGHNIANASTEGYTRQRVNTSATRPMEYPGLQRSNTPGQIGTGVQPDSIERIRENYLDTQYRRENQLRAMWSVRDSTFEAIQAIINEPSDNGIRGVLDKFWNSWEVLNRDPTLLSARVDVIGNAINLVDSFKQLDESFSKLTADLDSNINIKLAQANTLINQIAELNDYIRRAEGLGANANDYRDQRDLLVDQLSSIVDIQFSETAAGDYIVIAAGVEVVNHTTVVQLTQANVENATAGELAGYVQSKADIEHVRNELNALVSSLVTGEVKVRLENGYVTSVPMTANNDVTLEDGTVIPAGTTIPAGSSIISPVEFTVNGFNGLHELGYTLSDPAQSGIPFFVTSDGSTDFHIGNLRVNPIIASDTSKVAASGKYTSNGGQNTTIKGNSDIAHALASLRDSVFFYPTAITPLYSGTIDDYFRAVTSELGTAALNAKTNLNNQMNLVDSVTIRRQQVSGVSLDEEMTDMLKFQHAYNAAARNLTAVDDMLDRIINKMGRVGL